MYYPKSQIKTNLFTNGDEYALESTPNVSYVGYFYKTSTGQVFKGKSPQGRDSIKLVPFKRSGDEFDGENPPTLPTPNFPPIKPSYFAPTPSTPLPNTRFLPQYNAPKPTEKDYNIGEFRRYFSKKTNELLYLEVNKDTYEKLINQDPKIAFDLYEAVDIPWTLIGTPQSVFNTNKNIVSLVERNQKWYGFTSYFQDRFSEYYLEE